MLKLSLMWASESPFKPAPVSFFHNRPPPLVFRYSKILQAQPQLTLTLSLLGADFLFVRNHTEKPRFTLSVLSKDRNCPIKKKIMKSYSDSTLFLKSLLNVHTCISFLFHWKAWFLIILIFLLILPFITNKELTEWNLKFPVQILHSDQSLPKIIIFPMWLQNQFYTQSG